MYVRRLRGIQNEADKILSTKPWEVKRTNYIKTSFLTWQPIGSEQKYEVFLLGEKASICHLMQGYSHFSLKDITVLKYNSIT